MHFVLAASLQFPFFMKQQALLFLLGTALAEGSSGFVNLKDGSFQHSIKNENLERLELTYSSRQNATGIFGAGWCSLLDIEILPSRGRMLELKKCDRTTRFQKAKTSALLNADLDIFSPISKAEEQLERHGDEYSYRLGSEKWSFDNKGQWMSLTRGGVAVAQVLHRSPNSLRIQAKGEIIDLEFNSTNKVRKLSRQGAPLVLFSYTGAQLTGVQGQSNGKFLQSWTFTYDSDDNMTSLTGGGSPRVNLGYDRRTDRVATVEGRRECVEKFEYDTPEGPANGPSAFSEVRLVSQSFAECKRHRQLLTRIENRFLRTSSGELLLVETQIDTQNVERNLRFHPILGSVAKDSSVPQTKTQIFKPKARPETRLASE